MKPRFMAGLVLTLLLGCTQPVPTDHRAYVGLWEGSGMRLEIEPDGNASYERKTDGRSTSITGPAHDFTTGGFKIGIGPLSARFKVQQAPVEVQGQWRMTVDGVPLERVPSHETRDGIRL